MAPEIEHLGRKVIGHGRSGRSQQRGKWLWRGVRTGMVFVVALAAGILLIGNVTGEPQTIIVVVGAEWAYPAPVDRLGLCRLPASRSSASGSACGGHWTVG